MSKYRINYSKRFDKQLDKLDKYQAKLILKWLNKHINHSTNPRSTGKGLTGNLSDLWRYRIGDYRVIVKIEDDTLIVLALELGHRSRVYK